MLASRPAGLRGRCGERGGDRTDTDCGQRGPAASRTSCTKSMAKARGPDSMGSPSGLSGPGSRPDTHVPSRPANRGSVFGAKVCLGSRPPWGARTGLCRKWAVGPSPSPRAGHVRSVQQQREAPPSPVGLLHHRTKVMKLAMTRRVPRQGRCAGGLGPTTQPQEGRRGAGAREPIYMRDGSSNPIYLIPAFKN